MPIIKTEGVKHLVQRAVRPIMHGHIRKVHDLRFIFFELTRACNLLCLHCGSECLQESDVAPLAADDVIRVLSDVKKNYDPHRITVILSGGEPLCYPGLFELGRRITALEFPWGMVTNGYGWNKAFQREAKTAGLRSITVSLDGLEEDHDWMRGRRTSFSRAVRTIESLIADPFYQVMDVVTCVNKRNLKRLDELHSLIEKLGVKNWRLFTISPIGRAAQNPELILDAKEFRHLMAKVVEYRSRSKMRVTYSESGYLSGAYECKVRDHHYFCQAGISVAGIMINGDILACPNIDRRFAQGNIHKDGFVDVWENGYQKFRDRSWMKQGQCANCKEWRQCEGNSFHLWDSEAGKTKFCFCNKYELI